jgi:sulfatase modifying factor 1
MAENGHGYDGAAERARRVVADDLGMAFVRIEPGTFEMGSPPGEAKRNENETLHRVTLTRGFFMGTTEVTVAQFRQFIEATGYETTAEQQGWTYAWNADAESYRVVHGASWRSPGFERTDQHPVGVSWFDAVAFCDWLTGRYGATFRLPTEAEWEYACRAGTQTPFQWGDDPDDGEGWCNGADQTGLAMFPWWRRMAANIESFEIFEWSDGYAFTAPVGQLRANASGLYDMHGNIAEWCADWFAEYPDGEVTDPTGPASGTHRVLRGGGSEFPPSMCRSAHRFYAEPDSTGSLGFRVVLERKRDEGEADVADMDR